MLLKDCSLLLNILNNIFDCNRLGMKVDLLTQILPLLPSSTHKGEFNQQRTVGNQTRKISSALSHSPQPRVFHQWRKSRAIVKATLLTVSRWDDACQPCRCYQCFIFRFIIFFFHSDPGGQRVTTEWENSSREGKTCIKAQRGTSTGDSPKSNRISSGSNPSGVFLNNHVPVFFFSKKNCGIARANAKTCKKC